MMDKEEFEELVKKYLAGEASKAEETMLFEYYDKLQEQNLDWNTAEMGEQGNIRNKLYHQILQDIKHRERNKSFMPRRWMVAAAIMLAVLSSVLFFYQQFSHERAVAEKITLSSNKKDILPGENKATLTLADGSKIALDDTGTGELARQPGASIIKKADGQIIYNVTEPAVAHQGKAELAYNTIEIPKGSYYQINLPDGSRVWLNAGSSLRFPTRFTGAERAVALTGEAYFEVAKNKKIPFRVVSPKQTVEVLGTHFNVSAYADEPLLKTTLLEGSVRVLLPNETKGKLLEPGQQALVPAAGNSIAVQPVDVEAAIAWKNGYFMFVEEDLPSIMRKLERWYDIEVAYEGDLGNMKFGGIVSRSKSLAETLKILELTGNVQFKIAGRRVTVMP
ncbi:FecR domain-containing protein [Adhaeribacter rhizoryzae]|uniref:FecR family protein n=1 Tax=Adhaeribacter rhizoryzae TaxID=2607907 RepID=A0A5M6D652_9BACT|nr:FecR domain-containing protein [Adhaeribacter rhizoryzae]KAA5542978.1 FecR family protein [Adhaeribacter rhizoryzae]